MGNRIQLHAIFKGNVQGVGFRATVRYLASRLNVSGKATNKEDGSVELYVQGSKEAVEKLMGEIKEEFGPYITSASESYGAAEPFIEGFRIY